MSNNKQTMKLYTEEQLKKAIAIGFDWCHQKHIPSDDMIDTFIENLIPIELPSDVEIFKWWQTQKFQKERGEQEYIMIYEIDLPKILKAFFENLNEIFGGNK